MIEFNVPDISCGHCVGMVSKTVKQVDPAASVEVDLASKQVRITSALSRDVFAAALTDAGYPPACAG